LDGWLKGWLGVKGFGELLSETLDDTIRRVFGRSASELICRFVERQVMIKREEVGEKIEAFYLYLEKLLGSEGAEVIEVASLKLLCLRLRREYEEIERYFSLLDELFEIKFRLLAPLLEEEYLACN